MAFKLYDVTLPMSAGMLAWPEDTPMQLVPVYRTDRGDDFNLSKLALSAHSGTHVDAPCHFAIEGIAIEQVSLDVLVGPAVVAHLSDVTVITANDLAALSLPPETRRLLFKTRNSALWARGETTFQTDFVGLALDAAQWIVEQGIWLVTVGASSESILGDVQ